MATILGDFIYLPAVTGVTDLDMEQPLSVVKMVLVGNATVNAVNMDPLTDMSFVIMEVQQDATGSRLVTWGAEFLFEGGTAPTLSTGPGAIDTFTFLQTGGTLKCLGCSLNLG